MRAGPPTCGRWPGSPSARAGATSITPIWNAAGSICRPSSVSSNASGWQAKCVGRPRPRRCPPHLTLFLNHPRTTYQPPVRAGQRQEPHPMTLAPHPRFSLCPCPCPSSACAWRPTPAGPAPSTGMVAALVRPARRIPSPARRVAPHLGSHRQRLAHRPDVADDAGPDVRRRPGLPSVQAPDGHRPRTPSSSSPRTRALGPARRSRIRPGRPRCRSWCVRRVRVGTAAACERAGMAEVSAFPVAAPRPVRMAADRRCARTGHNAAARGAPWSSPGGEPWSGRTTGGRVRQQLMYEEGKLIHVGPEGG